jgi:hypothetical protein
MYIDDAGRRKERHRRGTSGDRREKRERVI